MCRILVSSTFRKEFLAIDTDSQRRIRQALEMLGDDPFTSRSQVDIKPLKDTDPKKYRLSIGTFRIVYTEIENEVRVIEVFSRNRGYRL
ncbi:MAG: type II toxin-antitoxin system RelE/ParE family toxin [Methanoregulaceae archaeon]|jgi:mRNA-degrading endonuclease RelE of RelBE toxin-antitoxin system|nr:type II toxin-antitoxin system RelE/ParE family toxin [Methanoregulaceae archaeon]